MSLMVLNTLASKDDAHDSMHVSHVTVECRVVRILAGRIKLVDLLLEGLVRLRVSQETEKDGV